MDALKPMAQLSKIQIRYHIRYITWLRTRAWAHLQRTSMSEASDALLAAGLDHMGVTSDPNVLLLLPSVFDDR